MGGAHARDGRELLRAVAFLVERGHDFDAVVGRYSPELINLFVEEGQHQDARTTLQGANVAAIATGVGFSGKMDPLKKLERALGVREAVSPQTVFGMMQELGKRAGPDPMQATRARNAALGGRTKRG